MVSELTGKLSKTEKSYRKCRKCDGKNVTSQEWESSDGAHEDYKYTCGDCGYVWWIDGIDS